MYALSSTVPLVFEVWGMMILYFNVYKSVFGLVSITKVQVTCREGTCLDRRVQRKRRAYPAGIREYLKQSGQTRYLGVVRVSLDRVTLYFYLCLEHNPEFIFWHVLLMLWSLGPLQCAVYQSKCAPCLEPQCYFQFGLRSSAVSIYATEQPGSRLLIQSPIPENGCRL